MPSEFYEKRLIQNRCRLTSPAGVESQHRQAHAFGNFGCAFQDFAAAVVNRMSGPARGGGRAGGGPAPVRVGRERGGGRVRGPGDPGRGGGGVPRPAARPPRP